VSARNRTALRLLFPQWQGTPAEVLHDRLPELTLEQASTAHHLGSRLLQLLAPASDTPTAEVPVSSSRHGLAVADGIYARDVVLRQLRAALDILHERDPGRVLVLGGDCSVSVAPFAHMLHRYDGDLAVVWLDAHPDLTAPGDDYTGFHAMALATLLGIGDAEFTRALPAHADPSQVLIVGLRDATPDAVARQRELDIASIPPEGLERDNAAVTTWLRNSGASRVAVHLDLGVLDAGELDTVGAPATPGLRLAQLIRLLSEIADTAAVVAFTVAEHTPRNEILVRDLLARLPLR
jgi:arginase